LCQECEEEKTLSDEDVMTQYYRPALSTVHGVAVEPQKTNNLSIKDVGGMKLPEVQAGLIEMNVVAESFISYDRGPTTVVRPGDKVYVTSVALARFPWAKEIFKVGDKTFIVVPTEYVVAVLR
jgi:hypothetical protein